jgi:hypothetical protein
MSVRDDLRETLLLCREQLGDELHPIYKARLALIWSIVQWACKCQPEHWQQALERAERAVDATLAKQR